ncbi:MAG TPA: thermonuclease family protein [Candidatus Omnitrophota bacterium]|nr:thermonuclease family protein [Candidatus Omnitrophota bacterium]HPN88172.1 thermonuclease family protein [Candidatus Omnitrophota bacterium]
MKTVLKILCLFFIFTASSWGQTKIDFLLSLDNKKYENVVVDEVLSADMIRIIVDGGNERIKLIGLKAPAPPKRKAVERDQNGFIIEKKPSPETPIEERAFYYAQKLLDKKTVRLEFDAELRDDEGRKLAYVFLTDSGLLVNAEILREGFAFLSLSPSNNKYAEELRQAYKEARKSLRGLHGE